MTIFKAKSPEVDAMQFKRETFDELVKFTNNNVKNLVLIRSPNAPATCEICKINPLYSDKYFNLTEGFYVIKIYKPLSYVKFDIMSEEEFEKHYITSTNTEIEKLKQKIEQLEYMIEHGLGWEDVKNDISYPPRD